MGVFGPRFDLTSLPGSGVAVHPVGVFGIARVPGSDGCT